jgi:hypothetical protein
MIRRNGAIKSSSVLKEGQVIVAFKRGSKGEVLGVYHSIREIYKKEHEYNNRFNYCSINSHLIGNTKTMRLLHLQAVCVLRIKNISDLKEILHHESHQ